MVKYQYGNWSVNPENLTLDYRHTNGTLYDVPLWEMKNSAEVLDWIFQVEEKTWSTPEDVNNFITALVEIFGRGICGGGQDHPITNTEDFLRTKLRKVS